MATELAELPSLDFNSTRIKRIRGALGKSQQEFADLLHVHVNTVIRWEAPSYETKPTKGHILRRLLEAERQALAGLQAASQAET